MRELIERTRLAAKILRDIGGQSEMAATVDEAAAALEAAREDVEDALGALNVAVLALAHASESNTVYMPAYIHVSNAIDQARWKGVKDEA